MTTEPNVDLNEEHEDDSPVVRELREKVKELQGAAKEKGDLERQLAFIRAGIDTDTKAGQYFVKAYDGELDPDAIKAEAAEVGILDAPPKKDDELPEEERRSTQEREDLSAGSRADENKGEDPRSRAIKSGEDLIAGGATTEDAIGEAFGEIARAGYLDKDKRAIYDPRDH